MLRINSLLYIEKLWSSPIIEEAEEEEQVGSREVTGYGSVEPTQKDILTKEIREEADQETSEATAYDVLDREVTEIHIPEQIDEVDEEEETQVAEVAEQVTNAIDQVVDAANENKEEEQDKDEEKSVEPKDAKEELKIDTKIASDTAVLIESPVEEVSHNQSNISSASSIPVVTPTSSQSTPTYTARHETVVTPRPRKTSLLRRETDKFNDRRKSLTKRLKRALTVDLKN